MTAFHSSGSWILNLIDAGARSLVMAAAVGGGLRVLRVNNVIARKVAWTLVLCGALVMPVLAPWAQNHSWLPFQAAVVPAQSWLSHLPRWRQAAAPEQAAPMRRLFPARAETLPETFQASAIVQQPGLQPVGGDHFPAPSIALDGQIRGRANSGAAANSAVRRLAWGETAALIYLVIAATLVIRIGVGCFATARLWMRATPVLDLAGQSKGDPCVRWSRDVPSPVTVGSGIVLPEDYTSWDPEKLRIVMAHESSHVRQGDFYLQLCAALYTAVFWFSPLGWWLKRTLCDLSEAVSDHAAVSEAANHASYAQVLLEFAALPRTTRIGVAMARAGRLSHRIERLLDESSFRRAFAGGRGRIVVAALLAPLALFAATSLIRVQAAGQQPPPPAIPAIPQAAPAAPAVPAITAVPPAPNEPPIAAIPPVPAVPAGAGLLPPPAPGAAPEYDLAIGKGDAYMYAASRARGGSGRGQSSTSSSTRDGNSYTYSYSKDGDSYALISGNSKDHIQFSGDWMEGRREQLEKARQMAHGDFLWFTHGGKSYVVDDPAIVGGIAAMYKPMEDLGRKQEELGRQQEELGRQQEELGEKMSEASIPTPDVSKEMAALNSAMAEMNAAKGKSMTQDQLSVLQERVAEVQEKLGELQGEIGSRQGEIGEKQGALGDKQGALGEQQGRLGEEQGRIAGEIDRKVKAIIDESIKDGKARPVE